VSKSVSRRGVVHLGLDVSKDWIVAGILRPDEQVPDVEKVFHDEESMRRLIGRFASPIAGARGSGQLGDPPSVAGAQPSSDDRGNGARPFEPRNVSGMINDGDLGVGYRAHEIVDGKGWSGVFGAVEAPWVSWRLLTLETKMESCQERRHQGSRPRVDTRMPIMAAATPAAEPKSEQPSRTEDCSATKPVCVNPRAMAFPVHRKTRREFVVGREPHPRLQDLVGAVAPWAMCCAKSVSRHVSCLATRRCDLRK
jgi:hypothetical protein